MRTSLFYLKFQVFKDKKQTTISNSDSKVLFFIAELYFTSTQKKDMAFYGNHVDSCTQIEECDPRIEHDKPEINGIITHERKFKLSDSNYKVNTDY